MQCNAMYQNFNSCLSPGRWRHLQFVILRLGYQKRKKTKFKCLKKFEYFQFFKWIMQKIFICNILLGILVVFELFSFIFLFLFRKVGVTAQHTCAVGVRRITFLFLVYRRHKWLILCISKRPKLSLAQHHSSGTVHFRGSKFRFLVYRRSRIPNHDS